MKTISMLEFRRETAKVIRWLTVGKERIRLTYRGRPLADLSPVDTEAADRPPAEDLFYCFVEHAVSAKDLSNVQIDHVLYGED